MTKAVDRDKKEAYPSYMSLFKLLHPNPASVIVHIAAEMPVANKQARPVHVVSSCVLHHHSCGPGLV
jgi:hypothetical protein